MNTPFPRAALVVALCAAALAGCDRTDMQQADRAGAEVGRKADDALAKTKDALSQAGRKTEQAFSDAGKRIDAATSAPEKGSDAARSSEGAHDTGKEARAAFSDAAITASIQTDILKDPDLSVLKIDVDTHDGVVTLNGRAASDAARTRAEEIAHATKGVREVHNHLTVKAA